jgi:O-succinylhomoserine sulfhydrylase
MGLFVVAEARMAKDGGTKDWKTRTRMVHAGTRRSQYGEVSEAIFLTQGFVYDSAEAAEARFVKAGDDEFIYARYGNPTIRMFEERMIALEDGAEECLATGSGMAAVNAAVAANVKAGDRVIGARAMFASCLWILDTLPPKFGVAVELVDGEYLDQWRAAAQNGCTLALIQTPANPTLGAVDIKAVADIIHAAGGILVVDNVFASPVLQKPLTFGADLVVYSATKHIDGHGRVLGGVILADETFIADHVHTFLRQTGPSLSPFNAWVLLKGLETLAVRVERQTANAARIADAIADHPKAARVLYPGRADHPQYQLARRQMKGGSTLVAFEVKGGQKGAFKAANALRIIRISNNLGDAKSLITHPSTTTHQRLTEAARLEQGITQGMLRLSVGLEDVDDLIEDLTQALDAVR